MAENYKILKNLFIILTLVYYAQGGLYESGSLLSRLSLVLILCLGMFFLIKSLKKSNFNNLFFVSWTLLLTLNILGFIFSGDISNSLHFGNFKNILFTSLTFYTAFHLSRTGNWTGKNINRFLILLFPLTIIQFLLYEKQQFALYNESSVVNNISYMFVAFIPFIFFIKKKILAIISIGLIIFFVLLSGKRGASIAALAGLFVYVLYSLKIAAFRSNLNRILSYFGTVLVLLFAAYFTIIYLEENPLLINRLTSGYASNRDSNYQEIFNYWYHSNSYINLIFGFGFASSIFMNGEGALAHNDWLEILSNYGILGITIYSLLFFSFFKKISSIKNLVQKYCLISIFAIWFLISLYSMFYNSIDTFLYAMLIGSVLGWQNTSKQEITIR